jgi:thioredoxin reductase (NADPH)
MSDSIVDVLIIGAGPAGIQAAIHAARKKTHVLVLGRIENSALYGAHIENYACIHGVTDGKDLLEAGISQVNHFGAQLLAEDVLKIEQQEQLFELELESGKIVFCRTIIFSMGVSKKKLSVPGENEFSGQGVSYCVDCDANFYKGATVMVVGNRSAAADGALTLLGYADKVYLVGEKLKVTHELMERLQKSKVKVLESTSIKEIHGDQAVSSVTLGDGSSINIEGIFIELGSKGALELATQVGVALDSEHFKYINTNRKQETNIAGIYAAGDIVGPPYQMAKAVGEGCVAGMNAATYARRQKKAS